MVFIFTDSIVKLNIEVEDNTKVGRIVFALEEVIQKIKTTSGPSQRFDDLVHSLGLNKDTVAIFHDVEASILILQLILRRLISYGTSRYLIGSLF